MGGFGSGRWQGHQAKDTVEDCYALDGFWCVREGILQNGQSGAIDWRNTATGKVLFGLTYLVNTACDSTLLGYSVAQGGEILVSRVPLLARRPNFGGIKLWFACPSCGGRARKIYLAPGRKRFACRRCYRLAYYVQRKDELGRANAKVRKIRLLLGGPGYLLARFPARPPGMWRRTYNRLMTEAAIAERVAVYWHGVRLDRIEQIPRSKADTMSAATGTKSPRYKIQR